MQKLNKNRASPASWVVKSLLIAGAVLLLCGCFPKTPVRPPSGVIYSSYKAPLQVNFMEKQSAQTPTDASAPSGTGATAAFAPTNVGGKVGISETKYLYIPFVGLSFGWEDAAIKKAAENGGLKKVYFADYETFWVLGIYCNFKVYAYGE